MMFNSHVFGNTKISEQLNFGKKFILGIVLSLIIPFSAIHAENLNQGVRSINNTVSGVNNTINNVSSTVNNVSKTVNSIKSLFGFGSDSGAGLPDGDFILPSSGDYNMVQTDSLRTFILNVINFLISFVGIVSIGAVIYAGYLYIMSAGDDGNMDKAKKIIIYAVIGILVVSSSYALVNTVINETVTGGSDRGGSGGGGASGNVPTRFAPGTTLPAGTVLQNGLKLVADTIVNSDGTVTLPKNLIPNTDTLNIVDLLSFQNGITVTGGDIVDLGNSAIISNDTAKSGIDFGLTVAANAVFDFGDGTQGVVDTISSPGTTLNHEFGAGKSYRVKVVAQTVDGQIHSFDKTIVVGGTTALFTPSRDRVVVGDNVVLNGERSSVSIGSIRSYSWSCTGTGGGCFRDIEGSSITASFGEAGTYTITLTVENAIGTSNSLSKTITVLNDKPIANFLFENSTTSPAKFLFNAETSQNVEGNNDRLIYEWNIDGFITQKTNPNTTYTFTSEGSKTVTLKVSQQVNGRTLKSETVTQIIEVQSTIDPNFIITQ